jgi:hypothetical protein
VVATIAFASSRNREEKESRYNPSGLACHARTQLPSFGRPKFPAKPGTQGL